jgi:hypothetical protein
MGRALLLIVMVVMSGCAFETRDPNASQEMVRRMTEALSPDGGVGGGDGSTGTGAGGGNSSFCSQFTLCQTDADCKGNRDGETCINCPVCGKHCWSGPVGGCNRLTCQDIKGDDGQPVQCGSYPDNCNGQIDCGSCPSGQVCDAGKCKPCVPKTCADFPGRCHSGQPKSCSSNDSAADAPIDATSSEGASSDSSEAGGCGFKGLDDGCGGEVLCACPNGAAAANVLCNAGGVCAVPGCDATNDPPGPSGTTINPPALSYKEQLPDAAAWAVCNLQKALTMPVLMDEVSVELLAHASVTDRGYPTCMNESGSSSRFAVKLNDCGYITRFEFSNQVKGTTEYCEYCSLGPPAQNMCSSTWVHQQIEQKTSGSLNVGLEVKRKPTDFLRSVLGPIARTRIVDAVLTRAGGALDSIIEVKLNKAWGGYARTNQLDDYRGSGQGTSPQDCPGKGQNCSQKRLQFGPQISVGAGLKISLPPKGSWSAKFVRIAVGVDGTGSAGGVLQYRDASGECMNETCFGLGLRVTLALKVGVYAKIISVYEGGISWQLRCRASQVWNYCLPNGTTPTDREPWECKWEQRNDYSGG